MCIKFSLLIVIIVSLFSFIALHYKHNTKLPIIAVANYGPHSSLEESIAGIKAELTQLGFIEGKNIKYLISDVNFDLSLIPQMISTLKHKKPAIMVVIATPIAQFAKHAIKNIPLVFNAITDPVTVGLLKKPNSSFDNITGASDKQNLQVLLTFAKQILPNATRVGVLYATAEANDLALIKMLKKAANKMHMQVIAIPIDEPRDISI